MRRLAAQLLEAEDVAFLEALKGVGLLGELDADELLRIASEADAPDTDARWVELLEAYYQINDEARSAARQKADSYFIQRLGEPATAASLVDRLSAAQPKLGGISLERIGGAEGPLVLRAGEHFCAVLDENEERMDTDEIDLSTLTQTGEVPMVTVRGLVRSTNVLLERQGHRERLISLRGDETREVYVRLGAVEAMTLAKGGYLEDDDPEEVMELAAW